MPLAIVFTTWVLAIVRTLDCAYIKSPPLLPGGGRDQRQRHGGALYLLLREFGAPEALAVDRYAKSRLGKAPHTHSPQAGSQADEEAIYKRVISRCGC